MSRSASPTTGTLRAVAGRGAARASGRPDTETAPLSSRRGAPLSSRHGAPPPVPPAMPAFVAAVAAELRGCVSDMNALAIVSACAAAAGVLPEKLAPAHLPVLITHISASFRFFGVADARRDACLARLLALCWPPADVPSGGPVTINVAREEDIVRARQAGKDMCRRLGFSDVGAVKVATAISELSRNIVKYAGTGSVALRPLAGPQRGIEVVAIDDGPGIPDLDVALRPGFKLRTGMGAGLRGTRALMDFFDVVTRRGKGTVVTVRKLQS